MIIVPLRTAIPALCMLLEQLTAVVIPGSAGDPPAPVGDPPTGT